MTDELIFLGTAGGRMSVARQLRASGDAIILTHRHLDHSGDVNAMIACTGYFPELEAAYLGDVLILNVVFYPRRSDGHLCLADRVSQATGVRTVAARDHQRLDLFGV